MKTNRRTFVQSLMALAGTLAVTGTTMLMTACASVVNDLVTAFQSILNILAAAGLVPGGALVVTALNNVLSEVLAYESAPAADKVTVGEKLALIIQIAQADLQTWYSGLGLTGPIAIVVESLVGVLLSTLAGLLPTLPQPVTIPAEVRAARALARQIIYRPVSTVPITRRGLDAASKQFRASFNNTLTKNGYNRAF
jgi:hypothetical protein